MSSRRRKMSDAESSEEEEEVLTDDDIVAEGDPLLGKEGALGSPAKATGTTEAVEGENSRGSRVDEEGYEEPEESDGLYNSDGEETASVLSTATAEGDGVDGLQGSVEGGDGDEGGDDKDEETSATASVGAREGDADSAAAGSEDAYGFDSEDDREGGDGDALAVGEAGDLDTGGGWGGADAEGEGGQGEGDKGSVEDKEAQRAAFAAAKAEEEAIKEERRAMRKNPAIIPTLGGFFVHDNRVGDGDAAGGDHQGSDGGEAEDDLVGKWRADALSPARGDAEDEERGASRKKKTSKKKATRWGRGDDDSDDDDEPWGHEGYEEVLRAEEEGRPISSSSDFWSNPTGKAGRDRGGAWKRGGSGRRGGDGGSCVSGAEQESFQDDLASAGNQNGSWSRSQRDGFEGTGRERGRGRGRGGSRGRDRDRGSRGRGGGSWREGHAAPLESTNPSETWPGLGRATGAGQGMSTAATTEGPSSTGETARGGSRIESGNGAGGGKSNPSGWGQPGSANGEGERWGMSSNLENDQNQRGSGSYAEGPNDWDDATAGKQSKGNNPSSQGQRRKPEWHSPGAPDAFEANGRDVAGRVTSRGGRGDRRQSPSRPRGAPPVHRKGRGTPVSRERRGGDGGGGQGSSYGGRKDRNQTAKPPASPRAPTAACGGGTGWGEPNSARTVDEEVGGWVTTEAVAVSSLQAPATSTASTRSNPKQTAAAPPPRSLPSALTADAKQWTGASRSREDDASAAAAISTLAASVALLPALSDPATATATTTAAGIASGARVAFGEETARYAQDPIPMNVTAAAEAGAGPGGAAIVAPDVEFGVGVNGSGAVPLHLQMPSFVPPPGGGGGVGGSLGSSGFVEGAGIETLMAPLSHLPPDQHAMLLHAHHQYLVAQIQMQRAQIYQMQQHAQRAQKHEELVRRQRVQNQLALDYVGAHGLEVQQHLQYQLRKSDADEKEEEWRRRQGKETQDGSQPEDPRSRQQHQQRQQQDPREDNVAREPYTNDARSSPSSSHKRFGGSSSIHSNATANGKSGGAAAGTRGYGPGAPRPAAPPSTLLVPIPGTSSSPSVMRLGSTETRGDSSPQLLVGQSMPLPQVVPGASAVGGGGGSGGGVPVAGNGLMAAQMGMQGAGVAMGVGGPGDLQQLQDMQIQGFYNHAAAAAAAGYFVTPGGQSLPVHLLAELSGGGGSWYPEQHSSPVPMAWGAGDGVVAGHGSGAVLSEDVVLPPQSDSWMRAAVQQELLREQQQQQLHDQAVAHQYQQQQHQYAAAVSTAAATGTAAAPGGAGLSFGGVAPPGLDMSQQPLLNAQAMSFQPPVAGSADPSQSGGAGDAYYAAQMRQQQQQQQQHQHRNQR